MRAELLTRLFPMLVAILAADGNAAGEEFNFVLNPELVGEQPFLRADSAARNLASSVRLATWAGDAALKVTHLQDYVPPVLARGLLAGLWDVPVALYASWTQHEISGHFRACAEHLNGLCHVTVAIPPPYGYNLGYNEVTLADPRLSPHGRIAAAFFASGREAQQLLSDEVVKATIVNRKWNRIASLLLVANWVEREWETALPTDARDVGQYYEALSEEDARWSFSWRRSSRLVSGLIGLLDPIPWLAAFAYAQHILLGTSAALLPDVWPGDQTVFIRPRFTEMPHGPEWGAQLLTTVQQRVLQIDVTAGIQPGSLSTTIYAEVPISRLGMFEPGLALSGWYRPIVATPEITRYRFGASGEGLVKVLFLPALAATARIGWKTEGYSAGRPFAGGPFGEIGIAISSQ